MRKHGGALKYIAVFTAVLVTLAGLLVGAIALVIVLWPPKSNPIDAKELTEGFEAMIFCPRLDAESATVWLSVMSGYELVVVAARPSDSKNPLVPSPGKIIGDPYTDYINVEIGAATAGRTSVAFDRPPADGDVLELRLRQLPAAPGTAPPSTFPAGDPFADARYTFRFTGGRFVPTETLEPCRGQ